jgi:glycerophosphoryl diester phosphodiesterase
VPDSAAAFQLAMRLGAAGVATQIRMTADGVPVISERNNSGGRLRRRSITRTERADLPEGILSLDELYELVGTSAWLAADVEEASALVAVVAAARRAGPDAEERLVVCCGEAETLAACRAETTAVLTLSTQLRRLKGTPEQLVADLERREIDALDLPHDDWSAGLVTLVHRFGCLALGRGAQHEREMAKVIDVGIDALASDHVDRLVSVAARFYDA